MVSPRERYVESVFSARVRDLGGRSFKIPAGASSGIPDRLVLMPEGAVYLVELKADDGALSVAQKLWHQRAAALGTQVLVVTGTDEARAWLPPEQLL